ARLLLVLPVRVTDYLQEQPVSFLRIQKQIEELVKEQTSLDEELAVVSDTRTFFNEYINRLEQQDSKCEKKEKSVKENKRAAENSDEFGTGFSGRCPICGQLSNAYGALQKHIMKCYFRIEKRTCFVGPYAQVQNPENIICDAYCKQQNAYCKRLQVLCSDHYKGFLTAKESVCGAPFAIYENGDIMNMQCPVDKKTIISKGQCAMTKDACDRHHNWGLALLGSLDNYRLTVVRRIEQVKIRIVQLREQYNRRYDVCTLLQNYRITDETDKYGMPKNVDYVNSVPEYIEKKVEWSEEVAEINKRLQKRLDDRFAAAERKKEEEKAQLEAMKKLKGKNKRPAKKKNPPAKRGRIAASSSSTRQMADQENTPMEVDQPPQQGPSSLREVSAVAPTPEIQRNISNESQLNFSHPSQTAMDLH
uniref:CpG binding protein C-terminal domain-containing protein n=1 Tax=Panagrolaimus sp. ES5 TaxID=591445 RepID=A0AC34FC50_9BILA